MKKTIALICTALYIILTLLIFQSCKKDPVEKAISDFFKKLKGTWNLLDFSSSYGQWEGTWDGGHFTDSYTYSFSNNIATCIDIHSEQSYMYSTRDTTTTTYGYSKSLKFTDYSRDDYLSYTESTTKSGILTTNDYTANWSNSTMEKLVIKIEDYGCKLVVDAYDNLILTCEYEEYSRGGGMSEGTKWTFRKI